MSANNRHIDELFREELGSYTELPAPAVWASLETRLDVHYGKTTPANGAAGSYRWVWYALLAVITAVILFFALRSFTAKHSSTGMLTEPVENTITYSDNNPPVTSNGSIVNNDDDETEEGETEKENPGKTETTGKPAVKTDGKTPVDKGEKANESNNAGDKTKSKHIAAAKANTDATIAKGKTAKSKYRNPKQAEQATANKEQGTEKSVAKGKTAKSENRNPKQAEQATANKEQGTEKSVAKQKTAKSKNRNPKQAEQATANKEQGTEKSVASKTKLAKNKSTQPKQAEQATGDEEQAVQKTAKSKTQKPKKSEQEEHATDGEEQATHKPIAGNKKAANNKTQKGSKAKPASNSVAKKGNENTKGERKPEAAVDNNNETDEQTASGASITANKNTVKNKNIYASAAGSQKNAAGTSNKKPAQKKPTAGKPAKQNTIPENDQPEWNVKQPPAKTNKQEDTKPKEPERNWQQGSDFTAKDNRNESGIKMSDYLKNQNNTGGGKDEAGAEEEEKKAGGGGGGATAGYEEKDKKKKDKDGKKFMFELGVKLGYEMGFGSYRANKGVIMPYLQYNLAPTIGLVIQPSLKYAGINKLNIGDPQSYYNILGSKLDSNHTVVPGDTITPGTITRRYYYSQSHDSIVIKHAITKKTYFEFELPVMLQYKLAKNFGVYFGVSVNYSKIAQIEEERNDYTGIMRYDTLQFAVAKQTDPAPAIPPANGRFGYDYEPYSKYNPAAIANTTTNPFRFNYMIGFNYLVADRIMLDVMYTKALSNQNYIPDARIREIYKQGYLRISLGYKLSK